MKHLPALVVTIAYLLCTPACAQAASPMDLALRPDAPPCKKPNAKRPKLGVDFANDMPTEIRADSNGDGWCDYALAVPYPRNSQMNSYGLDQLLALGQAAGWKPVFNGKKGWELDADGYAHQTWPTDRIDLTDIRLLFPKRSGAPFVLGLYAGDPDEGKRNLGNHCYQYQSVHRWDDQVGTFRKTDAATRDAVLNYYYSTIEKPCSVQQ